MQLYCNKHLFIHFINLTTVSGDYAGFDEKEPTSNDGGKAKVISELKENYAYNTVVMIGDGMTDFEACPPADAFIGNFEFIECFKLSHFGMLE